MKTKGEYKIMKAKEEEMKRKRRLKHKNEREGEIMKT